MSDAAAVPGTLAICLSGGGLRATLFHLGVIRALRRCEMNGQRAIDSVAEIYSVSGGSILAAHMILHWDRYAGRDEAGFAEAEAQILTFVQRNIRDRVLRRAALTALPLMLWRQVTRRPFSGRAYWLRREYDALLDKATIGDTVRPAGPTLHILSTSFRTGQLCSFSGSNFEIERRDDEPLATGANHIPLSFAVAASSAFPPMFPPLVVTDEILANPFDDAFLNPILLSDGGVYDNLGIEKFRRIMDRKLKLNQEQGRKQKTSTYPGTLIISNAGASFRASATRSYAGILSRNVRASDILMHRVGDNAEDWIKGLTSVNDTVVRLSTTVDDGTLDVTVQQRLRMVRTDLDRFSPDFARLLIEHGERVACEELRTQGWTVAPPAAPASPQKADIDALHKLTGRAANRSFRSLVFDFRDWAPLLTLWLIAGLLLYGAYVLVDGYRDARREKEAAAAALQASAAADRAENLVHRDRWTAAQDAFKRDDREGLRRTLFGGLAEAQDRVDADRGAAATPAGTPSPQPGLAPPGSRVTYSQPVYIQFAGTLTRDQIRALNKRLRDAGWNVQSSSGERIRMPARTNEVRFSTANAVAAQDLANAVGATGITQQIRLAGPNERIGGNLELWISK